MNVDKYFNHNNTCLWIMKDYYITPNIRDNFILIYHILLIRNLGFCKFEFMCMFRAVNEVWKLWVIFFHRRYGVKNRQ